jgi:hypothetical protein
MTLYNYLLPHTGTELWIDDSHMFEEKHEFVLGKF